MDDNARWQDAALDADSQLIGPTLPTSEVDYDDLETGIASIFAALQAAGPEEETDDDAAPGEDGVNDRTFVLLSELDRLWQRPSP